MNWKYVKTFLIVLLLAVNGLLGYLAYSAYSDTAFTSTATAEGAARVLEKSGISVSPDMLSVKNDRAKSLAGEYNRESYLMSVAAFLLGEEPSGSFLLPSGILAENSRGESVLVNSDLSLHYVASGIDESNLAYTPLTDEKELTAARELFASILGYDKGAFDGAPVCKHGDILLFTLSQKEENIPLYGYDCTFGIRDGSIVYASGKHFFGSFSESSEAPLLNRTNILLSEKARGRTGTVEKIDLCYVLYEDTKQDLLRLIPAYSVSYAGGETSIINALDASIFE